MGLTVGVVVQDRIWGSRYTGTVIGRQDDQVFVAWHGSFIEDQLSVDDVEVLPGAPTQLSGWRGGLGVLTADGNVRAEPVRGR